jgi:hypothetical protein
MRMKDAITVALVLGRELRDSAPEEVAGVEASIGAIRGHMLHVHSVDFDPKAFDAAVERGRAGGLGW